MSYLKKKKKLLCKQRKSALLVFKDVFFPSAFFPPAVHIATKTKWRRGEESTVELRNYAPIILLAIVMWLKVEMSASSLSLWDLPISPLFGKSVCDLSL